MGLTTWLVAHIFLIISLALERILQQHKNERREDSRNQADRQASKNYCKHEQAYRAHLDEPGFPPWDHVIEEQQLKARVGERLEEGLM